MFCLSTQNVIISNLLQCNCFPFQSNVTDVMDIICPNSIFSSHVMSLDVTVVAENYLQYVFREHRAIL